MWQPPLNCYSIPGSPSNPNPGDLLGQPAGAFHGGGFNPHVSSMGFNHPQSASTGQWAPPGQALTALLWRILVRVHLWLILWRVLFNAAILWVAFLWVSL